MTTLNELYNELVKLSTEERVFLILELMKADKISYQDITTAYTTWLEFKRKQISEDYQELKGRVLNEFVGNKKDRTKVLKDTIGYLVDKSRNTNDMENYEQKYKDALNWMCSIYPTMQGADKEDAEYHFPELKESEDEKIRKMLVRIYKKADMGGEIFGEGITYKQVIAWLEKQGEQNHAEWQKQQMNETLQTEYEKGRHDMQQEMMKDAVELHIVESFNPVGTENEKPHGFTALCYNAKYPDFYQVTGQTIKVVPIKEIQQNEQDCRKKGIGSISKR